MADLSELQAAGNTKITGSDSVGNETNYLGVDVSGNVTSNVNVANASAVIVMQNAVAVTGNGTSLPTTGYGTSIIQITGTFVASINFEASVDAGTTWVGISATQIGQGDIFTVVTIPGLYRLTVTGMDLIRARVSWTSGTSITINGRSTNAVNASKVVKLASGTNTIGAVAQVDGFKATYSSSALNVLSVLTATDIFTITGSATKTIRVLKISVSATQTNPGEVSILLLKRSTANTVGTSSASIATPHDSASAAGTATILSYTANPTVGTLVGSLRARKLAVPTTSDGHPQVDEAVFDFGNRPSQAIVLRGINQVLAFNLNGVTIAGGSFNFYVEWTEE